MNYQSHILPNGLRIVHKNIQSNVSYCGFIINAGTRDEFSDEFGMAHFVEHMLFKGTKKRRSHHIINRMETVGGELNAYTNKEETVIYSIFLENYFERAVELLTDLTFFSEFPQQEIHKEIDVVIDEIHSYEDNPSELIFDEFDNLIFEGSQLGHNILGYEKTLVGFHSAKVKSFVNRNYLPEKIVFFSLGNTDFKKIQKLTEKYLKDLTLVHQNDNKRIPPLSIQPLRKTISLDTSQAHVILGSRCYNLYNPKRKVLNLLNNILGGPGMNSKLNISLREKKGYVYSVESNITSYSDTGVFSVYFGTDKENMEKCISLTEKELKKIRENKISDIQLERFKKQLIGQIAVSADNNENVALSLGKSFLHYNHFDSMEETRKKIDGISSLDILETANEILSPENLFYLTIV